MLVKALNPKSPKLIPTSHATLVTRVSQSYQLAQDVVRKKLQSAISDIHLSLDLWTSPNNHLLLGVCAHFVDYDQKRRFKALLALRPVIGHSGKNQFTSLLPVLEDFGIVRKLGCVMADNASTNDTLCQEIEEYLEEEERIK